MLGTYLFAPTSNVILLKTCQKLHESIETAHRWWTWFAGTGTVVPERERLPRRQSSGQKRWLLCNVGFCNISVIFSAERNGTWNEWMFPESSALDILVLIRRYFSVTFLELFFSMKSLWNVNGGLRRTLLWKLEKPTAIGFKFQERKTTRLGWSGWHKLDECGPLLFKFK